MTKFISRLRDDDLLGFLCHHERNPLIYRYSETEDVGIRNPNVGFDPSRLLYYLNIQPVVFDFTDSRIATIRYLPKLRR